MNQSTRIAGMLFFLLLLVTGSGCNIIGAFAYKAIDPSNPLQYELPARPTLILVENYRQPELSSEDAVMVAQFVQSYLPAEKDREKDKVTNQVYTLIPTEKWLEYRSNHISDYHKMTIPQVGKAVGAEQVIYVDLQSSEINSVGDIAIVKGRATAAVKVVDVATGSVLWPKDIIEGRGVGFETSPSDTNQRARLPQIKYKLYDGLGLRIARFFMNWKQD